MGQQHISLRPRAKWRHLTPISCHLLLYVGKNIGLRLTYGRFLLVVGTHSKGTYYTHPRSNFGDPVSSDTALRASDLVSGDPGPEQAAQHRQALPRTRAG
jgi:hypothetical protein